MRRDGSPTPRFITAEEAARLVPDRARVLVEASGGGVIEPSALLKGIADRYEREAAPSDLSLYFCSGVGDRQGSGVDVLAQRGLVRRAVAGHWAMTPTLARMAAANEIEAYCLPQGVLAQLLRDSGAGRPGLITRTGLGTFVDPRQGGGKLNERTTEDLVDVMTVRGEELLFYPAPRFDVVLIRGTTADENGNLTVEHETAKLGILAAAIAGRNSGGLVIAQVKRVTAAGTMNPKAVVVPGHLIDAVVVDQDQWQTAINRYQPAFSGELRVPIIQSAPMPLTERKVIARRALDEIVDGSVVNLGVGMADGVAGVASEEGRLTDITLTVEQGIIGGIPERGVIFGVAWNPDAVIDHSSQFDFYDGGGLDIACLGFAEVDADGNVNSSMVEGRVLGAGGFINISQSARVVVFCGTLTSGGLQIDLTQGRPQVRSEGRHRKFVHQVHQMTFNARMALERGQRVIYVTERAVFRLTQDGPELVEVAPGLTVDDVVGLMDFHPKVAESVIEMDPSLYAASRVAAATSIATGANAAVDSQEA